MDIGAFALPALALLIFSVLVFVIATWVFDGTKPEEDTDVLGEEPKDKSPRGGHKGPLPRF